MYLLAARQVDLLRIHISKSKHSMHAVVHAVSTLFSVAVLISYEVRYTPVHEHDSGHASSV
jgi:hypothetical protein